MTFCPWLLMTFQPLPLHPVAPLAAAAAPAAVAATVQAARCHPRVSHSRKCAQLLGLLERLTLLQAVLQPSAYSQEQKARVSLRTVGCRLGHRAARVLMVRFSRESRLTGLALLLARLHGLDRSRLACAFRKTLTALPMQRSSVFKL